MNGKRIQRSLGSLMHKACTIGCVMAAAALSWDAAADDDMMGGMGGPASMGEMSPSGMESMEEPMVGPDPSTDACAPPPALSALPGYPDAPGLYHLGATKFFLDHPEHVTLSDAQRKSLEALQADAQKQQEDMRRQIEQRESQLWTLTGAEQPDASAIASKMREIEALRIRQRGTYIAAIGKAGEILTAEQRRQLVGAARPASVAAPSAKGAKPSPVTK